MYYTLYVGNTAFPAPGSIDGWNVRNNRFDLPPAGFDPPRTITNSVFCGNSTSVSTVWKQPC